MDRAAIQPIEAERRAARARPRADLAARARPHWGPVDLVARAQVWAHSDLAPLGRAGRAADLAAQRSAVDRVDPAAGRVGRVGSLVAPAGSPVGRAGSAVDRVGRVALASRDGLAADR